MAEPQLTFRPIADGDVEAVAALWEQCGLTRPWNDVIRDIAFARGKPTSDILLGVVNDELVSSIMVGHDGHRGCFYYVAVAPERQRQGIGKATVTAGERWLKAQGVWKVNLLVRQDNAEARGFYERLGYVLDPVFPMGRRLLDA